MTKAKLFTLLLAAVLAMPILSAAQTASGTLTVNATVQSSISMAFNSDPSGVVLSSGAGTNAATLDFGNISAYGTLPGTIARTVGASSFTVSTPFDVLVSQANGSSLSYTLKAQLNSADSNTWALGAIGITTASAATLTSSGSYGSNSAYTLKLTVPFSSSAALITNAINFTATAN